MRPAHAHTLHVDCRYLVPCRRGAFGPYRLSRTQSLALRLYPRAAPRYRSLKLPLLALGPVRAHHLHDRCLDVGCGALAMRRPRSEFTQPDAPSAHGLIQALDVTVKYRWMMTGLLVPLLLGMPAYAQQVLFTPEDGLSGTSQGVGSLKFRVGVRRAFHVQSFGKAQTDGSFRLDQTVSFAGQDPTTRSWVIRTVSPLNYAGELTDAAGPVSGHTSGRRLFLRYRVKGPFVMHQVLHLLPDGKTIDNVGRITLLGVPVGFLEETIRRRD